MPPKNTPADAPSVDAAAKAPLKAIKLLAPHEHAGRDYPAGAVLDLELHGLDLDSAAWLIGLGKAEEHTPAAAE
ncbi:hypothetical protein [Zoogloea sp.]|uniref:DUF7210 family protein n=1 Tax=Zoogloea sp. TaxID=49181 RepID=UPI001AD041B8|nr:hypothetical protein [Zoogloea sp.]MBN8283388.1 hypothetical protein [Zoogloea sp.]